MLKRFWSSTLFCAVIMVVPLTESVASAVVSKEAAQSFEAVPFDMIGSGNILAGMSLQLGHSGATHLDLWAYQSDGGCEDLRMLEGEALYRKGVMALSNHQLGLAEGFFRKLLEQYPKSPFAPRARGQLNDIKLLKSVQSSGPPPSQTTSRPQQPPVPPVYLPRKEKNGDAELIVSQTIAGGYVGTILPILMDADEKAVILGLMAGTTAGLVGSIAFVRNHDISAARAATITYAQFFAAGNLLGWSIALAPDAETLPFVMSAVGIAAGPFIGSAIYERLDFSEGQIAFIGSSGLWTTYLTELLMLTVSEANYETRTYMIAAPLSADLGAVAAATALYNSDMKLSRSRVRLINLGGGVAGLMMGGVLVLTEAIDSGPAIGLLMTVAHVGGLVGAFASTRDWDRENHPEVFAKNPVDSLIALEDGHWRLGQAIPRITFRHAILEGTTDSKESKLTPYMYVKLASGKF